MRFGANKASCPKAQPSGCQLEDLSRRRCSPSQQARWPQAPPSSSVRLLLHVVLLGVALQEAGAGAQGAMSPWTPKELSVAAASASTVVP